MILKEDSVEQFDQELFLKKTAANIKINALSF